MFDGFSNGIVFEFDLFSLSNFVLNFNIIAVNLSDSFENLPRADDFAREFPELSDFCQLTGNRRVETRLRFEGAWASKKLWRNLVIEPVEYFVFFFFFFLLLLLLLRFFLADICKPIDGSVNEFDC